MDGFIAIADGVHVWRCPVLDVNATLIVGDRRAVLVDTLSTAGQAAALAGGVRAVTRLPVAVVNTHDHFDHVFGNATVASKLDVTQMWAHPGVVERLRGDPGPLRAEAAAVCRDLAPEIVDDVETVEILSPNRTVSNETTLDIGGRAVTLWHPGPAHTAGDLVVIDPEVLVAGDLVEESGEPMAGPDADIGNWPRVLDALVERVTGPVVPGHGAVVDAGFVARQRDSLARR